MFFPGDDDDDDDDEGGHFPFPSAGSVDSLGRGGTDVPFTSALWSSLTAVDLPHSVGIQAPTVECVSASSDLPTEGHWCPPACSIAWSVSHMPA